MGPEAPFKAYPGYIMYLVTTLIFNHDTLDIPGCDDGEPEGTEINIKVNVIGTFLLSLNLFPVPQISQAKTGQTSVIVIVSPSAHFNVEPSIFDAFYQNKQSHLHNRYNVSKQLEAMLVRSIAAAMKESP
ncbi:hypothetical protein CFIMG_004667RA [Ceratocystis fimbriata CBS 114723]|uniref:Uncharacterized protein n=1 Tax=Ceratocystis fimbriata CBS 114723 TaxID=1035309 RepID=A0A2C5WY75_9PEZI|nr:hypothetical protein CFIMG_004667RA [Ceratocystis fimbriata CBS 114723]